MVRFNRFWFQSQFLRLFFEVKGIYLQIFNKKYLFLRSMWFFENENLAASGKICKFFGIELIIMYCTMYIFGSNVSIFKNRKEWKSLHPNKQDPTWYVSTGFYRLRCDATGYDLFNEHTFALYSVHTRICTVCTAQCTVCTQPLFR